MVRCVTIEATRASRPPSVETESKMSKKSKRTADAAVLEAEVPVVEAETPVVPVEIDSEVQADNAKARSVVAVGYKTRYAERAANAGIRRKAAQRSTWDWLAQTIAGECLVGKDRLDVDRFIALLDKNGVDHSRWTNRSKGWEGRLRMTGRLALQRVVAECGLLQALDGETLEAPAEWVAKHTH